MEKLSKETIDIALQFAKWTLENDSLDYNSVYDEWSIFVDSEGEYFSVRIAEEDLFEMFLKEEVDGE